MGYKLIDWCKAIAIATPLTVYAVFVNAYVLMCIWEWFVSIPFELSTISYKTSLCICVVVGFLNDNGWQHIPSDAMFSYLRHIVLSPIVTLCMCYLIQLFFVNGLAPSVVF